jgi:hypothetical protein
MVFEVHCQLPIVLEAGLSGPATNVLGPIEAHCQPCLHSYHKQCANQLLKTNCSCSVCKTNVKTLMTDTPRITGKPNGLGLAFASNHARGGAGSVCRALRLLTDALAKRLTNQEESVFLSRRVTALARREAR